MTDQEIPDGFKELKIPQPHIENLGPGFYKKEDDQLFMIFFALPDIVHMVTGTLPHQPIIAILINLTVAGLLLFGWKKGTV